MKTVASGLAEIERRDELPALGVQAVLERPFTTSSLLEVLEGALAGGDKPG